MSGSAPGEQLSRQRSQDQGACQCSICHEDWLSQEVCALKCGHVYHYLCIQAWLGQKRAGDCPQCKAPARSKDLRVLKFEIGTVTHESLDEVLRFEKMPEEERQKLEDKYLADYMTADAELSQAKEEMDLVAKRTEDCRRERREVLTPAIEAKEAVIKVLQEDNEQKIQECTKMQLELDKWNNSQQRRLPIAPVRDEDPDVHDERRKLRTVRATERAQQLHSGLIMGRQQHEETRAVIVERKREAESMEEEVKRRRQQDSRLRRQRSELQDLESSQASQGTGPVRSPMRGGGLPSGSSSSSLLGGGQEQEPFAKAAAAEPAAALVTEQQQPPSVAASPTKTKASVQAAVSAASVAAGAAAPSAAASSATASSAASRGPPTPAGPSSAKGPLRSAVGSSSAAAKPALGLGSASGAAAAKPALGLGKPASKPALGGGRPGSVAMPEEEDFLYGMAKPASKPGLGGGAGAGSILGRATSAVTARAPKQAPPSSVFGGSAPRRVGAMQALFKQPV